MTPPDSFVPLTAAHAPPTPREYRVAIISDPSQAAGHGHSEGAPQKTGFQSLESQLTAALPSAIGTEKKIGEPRVTVQRDGDRVTHLRIQCICGQVLDLACVYDAPPADK
jgi:hypothetical protein